MRERLAVVAIQKYNDQDGALEDKREELLGRLREAEARRKTRNYDCHGACSEGQDAGEQDGWTVICLRTSCFLN